jgi:ribosomal protein S27E
MNLTPKALATMARLGDRYAADGFPNPWTWLIAKDDFEGAVDGLIAAGLVGPKAETRAAYHLSDEGRRWVLEQRGLVGVFCPKCSTDEVVVKGQSRAAVRCHVCGVVWHEDTTVEPFVPRYR